MQAPPPTTHATNPPNPILQLYVWRCANPECQSVNETMGTEADRYRVLPDGDTRPRRTPCFYGEKCTFCSEVVAGEESCLLLVRLVMRKERKGGGGEE